MKLVWRIGDLIDREFEPLAVLESLDNGKTVVAAKAYDVPTAREQFYYMSGWATRIEGRTVPVVAASLPARYHAYTRREPIGVCGQITPWNFPLQMAAWKLAPALAAGCAVVLKPAEQTPLSAVRLVELCEEAGVPAGVSQSRHRIRRDGRRAARRPRGRGQSRLHRVDRSRQDCSSKRRPVT